MQHLPDAWHVAPCSEFPNDNPALHAGSIWAPMALGGPPVCERGVSVADWLGAVDVPAASTATVGVEDGVFESSAYDDEGDDEPIEIVDDLGFGEVESKLTIGAGSVDAPADEAVAEAIESKLTIGADPMDPRADEALPTDPFLTLATVVKDVARTFGADPGAAARLDAILGLQSSDEPVAPQAVAWRGILRGESEDYEACGTASLDEWAADVVARVVGTAGAPRTDGIRRELRRRGVAAFGLVA